MISIRPPFLLKAGDTTLDLGSRVHLMGILNVTPDSFSDGGRYVTVDNAVRHAEQMVSEGVDIIDIGGESTRPAGPYGDGAQEIDTEEELRRTIPVVEAVSHLGVLVSIDTMKAAVAQRAVASGASIVNDVSAMQADADMARVVADSGAAIVLMHMKGTPRSMQKDPQYDDVIEEIGSYLRLRCEAAAEAGILPDSILVDPGLGFGKRYAHNAEVIAGLAEFHSLGFPLLVGASRKSFTGAALDLPPADRLEGSLGVLTLCAERGAHIFRVHDVAPSRRVLGAIEPVLEASSGTNPDQT